MNLQKEKLIDQLRQIERIIQENEKPDGTFRFDAVRAEIALDFAKTEIEKSISE